MAIKIIKEPDIYLTQEEHDRLHRAWEKSNRYTTEPQSFEDFVASQKARSNVCACPTGGVSAACRMHGDSGLETPAESAGEFAESVLAEKYRREHP